MQLKDWLYRLERLHFKSIDMGLERIQVVADRLNLRSDTPFIFTVAGTNGKGSTVAQINELLCVAGYSTGVYTSPHLVRFNERVCVNGQQCPDEELTRAFEAVEAERGDIKLTYFEFTTLAAIWLFSQSKLDAWILEVGLGGRLDAVNVWDPGVSVVTSIDIDHQEWLGSDRTLIGIEKIGISRAGQPLIMGEAELPEPVAARAQELGCQLVRQGVQFQWSESEFDWSLRLTDKVGGGVQLDKLPKPAIYLQNAATALQAIELSPFTVSQDQIKQALAAVTVPGRRQIVNKSPTVMLDVGHNPHAASALATCLEQVSGRRVHCVIGMLADKDIIDTVFALLPVVELWYPAELAAERAASADSMRLTLQEMGARCGVDKGSAAEICRKLVKTVAKNDLILVFGSFYTVADVIQYGVLTTSDKD